MSDRRRAVACDKSGLAVFELLRRKSTGEHVLLYAFDCSSSTVRTFAANRSRRARRHWPACYAGAGLVFHHACALGSEGIVSKRLGSPYRSGRSKDWLKFKNPAAAAVKREAEEDGSVGDPNHWRARAEEAHTLADEMSDETSTEMMLQIAEGYERLAEHAGDDRQEPHHDLRPEGRRHLHRALQSEPIKVAQVIQFT